MTHLAHAAHVPRGYVHAASSHALLSQHCRLCRASVCDRHCLKASIPRLGFHTDVRVCHTCRDHSLLCGNNAELKGHVATTAATTSNGTDTPNTHDAQAFYLQALKLITAKDAVSGMSLLRDAHVLCSAD